MNIIQELERRNLKQDLPEIGVGDTVVVSKEIIEGKKKRVQKFEGLVVKIQNTAIRLTIVVRKLVDGVGVEKSFLLHAPQVVKVEVKKKGRVRRARLFYLRQRVGKQASQVKAAEA